MIFNMILQETISNAPKKPLVVDSFDLPLLIFQVINFLLLIFLIVLIFRIFKKLK